MDAKPDVKPEAGGDDFINLRVVGSDGQDVHFKIKKVTQMRKLMDAYCTRKGLNEKSVRFVFDGANVNKDDTPVSLEMEDNDSIDVHYEQTGGSC